MKARLGKRYTNFAGRMFQRVIITDEDGTLYERDIRIRDERDGYITMTGSEAKAEALARFAAEQG